LPSGVAPSCGAGGPVGGAKGDEQDARGDGRFIDGVDGRQPAVAPALATPEAIERAIQRRAEQRRLSDGGEQRFGLLDAPTARRGVAAHLGYVAADPHHIAGDKGMKGEAPRAPGQSPARS